MLREGIDTLGELPIEAPGTLLDARPSNSLESSAAADADFSSDSAQVEPCVGDKVSVRWTLHQE